MSRYPEGPTAWANLAQAVARKPSPVFVYESDERPEAESDGLLYFVAEGESGNVKIGVSTPGGFQARLKGMQTDNSQELVVLRVVRLPSPAAAFEAEQRLHGHFHRYRVRGEWFRQAGPLYNLRGLERAFRALGMRSLKDDDTVWSSPRARAGSC